MLLRSSSTPVLGSLLSSFSECPNINNHHDANTTIKHHLSPIYQNKLSSYQTGCLNLGTASCNSSPSIPDLSDMRHHPLRCVRRAQSDGNLEGLAYASCNNDLEFDETDHHNRFSGRSKCLMLETIPSFSFYGSRGGYEGEEEDTDVEDGEDNEELEEKAAVGVVMEGGESRRNQKVNMVLTKAMKNMNVSTYGDPTTKERGVSSQEMYLAKGLGIGGGGGGGGGGWGEFNQTDSGGDNGDKQGIGEFYKRMMEGNPGNALFLRNYAQFLYQTKKDLWGAENYYARAVLADPYDGEILSQYAKLVWELHRDKDRALLYFERAVQASSEDSHVHAAYASFLWQTEEEEDEYETQASKDNDTVPASFCGPIASVTA